MCSLFVNDSAAAHEVYTEKLGFSSLMAIPEANLFIVQSPEVENGPGLLLEPNFSEIASDYQSRVYQAGLPAITFGVPDVAAEVERLRELGFRIVSEAAADPSGVSAVIDDSCGNLIQLHQD